jgi:hypothetical protein
MPFNFQAVQTLKITAEDSPNIDVHDGYLVLTATRNNDQIMITAPINSVLPSVKAVEVKTSKVKSKSTRRFRPLAKLTAERVVELRSKAASSEFMEQFNSANAAYCALAQEYGIHLTTVYGIVNRHSWKNI